jgi:hypothetical protein
MLGCDEAAMGNIYGEDASKGELVEIGGRCFLRSASAV